MKRWTTVFLTTIPLLVAVSTMHAAEAEKPTAEPKLTVVNVSSHCIWTWKHSRAWHKERFAEIIRRFLLIMREHPNYVWLLQNENDQLAPFLEKARRQWPELVDEFWQRVRQGRIEVIIGTTNPRLSEIYPETFVRDILLSKQYFRRQVPGIEQKVYDAVDVMCGHSQMPQILTGAGYRYFMFSRPIGQQVVFWRKGLDGTRMLSSRNFYSGGEYGVYGGDKKPPDWFGVFGREWKGIRPVPVWRLPIGGDDVLPSPELAEAAETWDPNKKVLTTTARYFEVVEKYADRISQLEGVLDSLSHYGRAGLLGNHDLYTWNNQNEDLLLCLEKARVMASTLASEKGVRYLLPERPGGCFAQKVPDPFFADELWHDLLSCACHAIQWSWKADYENRYEKVSQTRQKAERALFDALSTVAGGIRFRSGLGSPLVVFNFQSWPVTGPVEFTLEGELTGLALRDGAGRNVPVQFIEDDDADGRRVAFVAQGVPACGYETFYLSRSDRGGLVRPPALAGLGPIENDLYRIRMQPGGKLEVFDNSRESVLGSPEHGGLGDLVFYEAPPSTSAFNVGPLGKRHVQEVENNKCRYCKGPVFASLRSTGGLGPGRATREVRLWRGSRRIDYLVEIDAQDGRGVFCIRFPIGLPGQVTAGIPFGAEPREDLDREPFRGEFFATGYPKGYYATRWTDVSTSDLGYTFICPPGMHTGYAYDRRGERAIEFILLRIRERIRLTRGRPKGQPDTYGLVHPWITGTGRHSWRCALVPHQGTWREACSFRDSLELHVPLIAFSPDLGLRRACVGNAEPSLGSQLDDATSFAEVTPAGVVLSALRLVEPAEDSKLPQWELRLYETTGRPADVVVRLGRPVGRVRQTNLLGEPSDEVGKIDASGNQIRFRIQPWKIVTLRITPLTTPGGCSISTQERERSADDACRIEGAFCARCE